MLIKGKKAKTKKGFQQNVDTELEAGKPIKQALKIAYVKKGGEEKKSKKVKKKLY